MYDVTLYPSGRGGGKTHWLVARIFESLNRGHHIAVVNPTMGILNNLERAIYGSAIQVDLSKGGWAQGFSEATLENSSGLRFDHIYIDNADRFMDNPAELCARLHPGTPVTMTVTPDPFPALPVEEDPSEKRARARQR